MPDRWGRVGYNDFMGIANVFGQINNMNKQNQFYSRQNKEQARQDQVHKDAVINYAALGKDPNAQLVGGPEAENKALEWTERKNRYLESITDMNDKKEVSEISELMATGQWERLPPEKKKQYKASSVAQGGAAAALTIKGQADAQKDIETAKNAQIENGYQTLLKYRGLINDAIQKGDKATAGSLISDLSKKINMPYQYQYNQGNDRLEEYYMHSGSGQYEKNGANIPMSDAVDMVMKITPEQYRAVELAHMKSLSQWNEDARKEVGQGGGEKGDAGGRGQYYKKDGQEYYIFPQKTLQNGVQQHYIVLDKDNNETVYQSMADLQRAGFRYRDMKREKDQAAIDADKSLIEQRNTARDYDKKRIAALGMPEYTYYDRGGNAHKTTDQSAFEGAIRSGQYTAENPKVDNSVVEDYNRRAQNFATKASDYGITIDENGKISGVVSRENLSKVEAMARESGVDLADKAGRKIDQGWFESDKPAFEVTVLDYDRGVRFNGGPGLLQPNGKPDGTGWGKRADGTEKGNGFFGPLQTDDGLVATEISIGVEIDGKEVEIPTLVPTLTKDEVDMLMKGGEIPKTIIDKAVAHAKKRMKEGKSPFAQDGEQIQISSSEKSGSKMAAMGRESGEKQGDVDLSVLPEEVRDRLNETVLQGYPVDSMGGPVKRVDMDRGLLGTIGTNIQQASSWAQPDNAEKFGESNIEFTLRKLGVSKDLKKLKNIADALRKIYPDYPDENIVAMLTQRSKNPRA